MRVMRLAKGGDRRRAGVFPQIERVVAPLGLAQLAPPQEHVRCQRQCKDGFRPAFMAINRSQERAHPDFCGFPGVFPICDGAAYRTRTCDPRITNAMLYQLS